MALRTRNDWQTEEQYWRDQYQNRPYYDSSREFEYYRPAYRFGYDASDRYADREWDDVESDLERDWDTYSDRGQSTWAHIKHAVRDAWDRVTGRR